METVNNILTPIRTPVFKLLYNKKDITRHIYDNYTSISYQDSEHGQSDEITVTLEDAKNLWISSWYPTKGDTLSLWIGYEGSKLLSCGDFEIDEIEVLYRQITLKGVSASIKKPARELKTLCWRDTSLGEIAETVAKRYDYKLLGNIKNIKISYIMQKGLGDLAFLRDLASTYGYLFKIANSNMVFYALDALEKSKSALRFGYDDLLDFCLRDKTDKTYKACSATYYNPKTGKLTSIRYVGAKGTKGDTYKLERRFDSKEQAKAAAIAALKNASYQVEGSLSFEGNIKACTAAVIALKSDFKRLAGSYRIVSARHTISKDDGYKTDAEVKKIA